VDDLVTCRIVSLWQWLLGSAENWMASLWQYATLIVLEAQQKSHQQTTRQDLLVFLIKLAIKIFW
jgi:hypothetical protein